MMEIEEILKLPDYDEIKNNFIGKYKDDIIVKYKDMYTDEISDNFYRRNVYILYKLNDNYIGVAGTITKAMIDLPNKNVLNELSMEYEKAIEESIEIKSYEISDILEFDRYLEAENKLVSRFRNDILVTYKDYNSYRYVYYLYGTPNNCIKHMSGFLLKRLNKENFLQDHIRNNETVLVNMINEQINK